MAEDRIIKLLNYSDYHNSVLDMDLFYHNQLQLDTPNIQAVEELRFQWIISRLPDKASVLDVGCGLSYLGAALHKTGIQYTGIDISQNLVEWLKSNFANIDWVLSTVFNYNKCADVVIAVQVMEHMACPITFLLKLIELAKDKVLCTVPVDDRLNCERHFWKFSYDVLNSICRGISDIYAIEQFDDTHFGVEICLAQS